MLCADLKILSFRAHDILSQRRTQRRRTGRATPCLKNFKGVFLKIRLHKTHKHFCNHHAMFTLCISLQKVRVFVKGHQKKLQTSRIIPRPRFLNSWIRHCISRVWWHIYAITCQIIMSSFQIFMLTCQLFMSTCQMIMSTCQKNIITTSSSGKST